jgi:hypothetical protein
MAQSSNQTGNRRLVARKACLLSASYQVKSQWHPATAMDLSRRGCRLRLGENLARDARVLVQLECTRKDAEEGVPSEPRRVVAEGSIVWSRREGLSYQCGIHFIEEQPQVEELDAHA